MLLMEKYVQQLERRGLNGAGEWTEEQQTVLSEESDNYYSILNKY